MIAHDALLLVSGFGLLRLISTRRQGWPFGVLGGLGLSFLAGVALLAAVTTLAGTIGLSVRAWPFIAPAMAIPAIAGGLSAVRMPRNPFARLRASWRDVVPEGALLAVVGAIGSRVVWAGSANFVASNDEYAIWALKGRALAMFGRLDLHLFANGAAYGRSHLDYPLAVPALIAWTDPTAGGTAHVHVALIAVAMLAVVAWGARRLAGAPAAFAAVALIAANARLGPQSVRLFGDVPLASFAVAAVVLLAVWIRDDDGRALAAAAVMVMGMTLTKNEGLLFSAAALGGALAACGPGRRIRLARAFGLAIVPSIPWFVYVRLHRLPDDAYDLARLAPLTFVRGLSRLRVIIPDMIGRWPGGGALTFVLLGAVLVIGLGRKTGRSVALQLGITTVVAWFGLALVYTLSTLDLRGHIASSASRVTIFPALLVLLAIPLLAWERNRFPEGPVIDR